ncbi:MAG: M67 family metallopeptidase [Leptolyngbyaceae cyanobacterium MO_188.B28]|nr:M67 family metallopeptidase [Leptolyngbyaceae cyanobacterium MO_188.B28]
MVLTLSSEQVNTIQSHAEHTYPDECCGLLVGQLGDAGKPVEARLLSQIIPVENDWSPTIEDLPETATPALTELTPSEMSSSGKSRRYWIDPKDLLAAQKYARDRNLDIIGIYHSHPNHPAIPSECDRALAWPEYSYIIVSVQQGQAMDLKSWRLDSHLQFQPEPLMISETCSKPHPQT